MAVHVRQWNLGRFHHVQITDYQVQLSIVQDEPASDRLVDCTGGVSSSKGGTCLRIGDHSEGQAHLEVRGPEPSLGLSVD